MASIELIGLSIYIYHLTPIPNKVFPLFLMCVVINRTLCFLKIISLMFSSLSKKIGPLLIREEPRVVYYRHIRPSSGVTNRIPREYAQCLYNVNLEFHVITLPKCSKGKQDWVLDRRYGPHGQSSSVLRRVAVSVSIGPVCRIVSSHRAEERRDSRTSWESNLTSLSRRFAPLFGF